MFAVRRAFPWRFMLQMVGTIATIGGGMIAVSTPGMGAWIFGIGLVALIAAAA